MGQDWGQHLVDPTRPNVARVYDFYLGGRHNFPADRELAEQVITAYPWVPDIMRQNRAFLRNAVTHMCAQGITQFLDLGAGLPTEGAVHEVAQAIEPKTRVVYVDIDPVAVVHTTQILNDNPLCTVVRADFADIETILAHPGATALLDMSQPIGVLSLSTLHFIDDDTAVKAIVNAIHDHVPPASLYAITHGSADERPDHGHKVEQLYHNSGTKFKLRTRQQLQELITPPFRITPPGLVPMDQWQPDTQFWPEQPSQAYACIAVKPANPTGTAT